MNNQNTNTSNSDSDIRSKLTALLSMAIVEGKILTALKIIDKDPSILDANILFSGNQISIMRLALDFNMESLVDLGLKNGISPTSMIFGKTIDEHLDLMGYAVNNNNSQLAGLSIINGYVVKDNNAIAAHQYSFDIIELAVKNMCDAAGNSGNSSANIIVAKKTLAIVQMLVDCGAKTGCDDIHSLLPAIATHKNLWQTHSEKVMDKMVKDAIKKGANINAVIGSTPLVMLAIGAGNVNCALELIRNGADTSKEFLGIEFVQFLSQSKLEDKVPEFNAALLHFQIEKQKLNNLNSGLNQTNTVPKRQREKYSDVF